MALKLGELVAILKTDDRPLEKGLGDGRRKVRAAGQAMQADAATTAAGIARNWGSAGARGADAFTRDAGGRLRDTKGRFVTAAEQAAIEAAIAMGRAGREGGEGFTRDANGRLRDGRGKFVSEGRNLGGAAAEGIGGGIRGGFGVVSGAMSSLMGVIAQSGGPIIQTLAWFAALGAAAASSASAIGVLGGALGSLPGLIGGLGALTGVLGLGFMGLDDAFKKVGGGGGSGAAMVDRAYQIAQAERRVRDANEEVTASQENLTRARVRAKEAQEDLARAERRAAENLQDLSRDLAGAKLSQESAALRVTEAEVAYQEALRRPWEPLAIQRAELALREAQHAAEESKDRVEDLGEEHAEAAKKGIKGSDEVKAAQERHRAAVDEVAAARKRERAAVEGVADAEHALQQARKPVGGGGGGGAGQEITKLAPAAQAAVDAIKRLKPAFEDLRLAVQERLFKGVGDRITSVAEKWKGTLKSRLTSMAGMVNGLFHNLGESVSKKSFIKNMDAGMASFERMIGRIGEAITGPFMDAWGRLSAKAGPFMERFGVRLANTVEKFSEWIRKADESGALKKFFEDSAETMEKIWVVGEDIVEVVGKFLAIIFPDAKGATDSVLDGAHVTLERISAWLDRPENQQKIKDIIEQVKSLVRWFEKAGEKVGSWYNTAKTTYDRIKAGGNALITWVRGLPGRISSAASGMWNGLKESFKGAVNWVIARWNNLSFSLPSVSTPFGVIGGARMDTPNIPYLAQGGIVPATPGGRLVGVAEGGEDEAVIPLSKLRDLMGRTVLELRSSGAAIDDLLVEILRGAIKWRGGDVQVVLGQ
ncbi:hypothetical protein Ait01nite_030020 [Actinoplanes italicus]|uniref:Phage-related protein n=1 Tax=Actinoplanes italicus TaxID=113567 RepID=A0A2T0KIV8_9ACTN|nr:hypothetical protein [Actinoplanes italicus]PRX23459.1 hypothetical protein CLV67_103207 [Actinoplanes italicus]GIE29957.1 hypothetical protein Ait01nite_030020 [Actinoplanes italicus]